MRTPSLACLGASFLFLACAGPSGTLQFPTPTPAIGPSPTAPGPTPPNSPNAQLRPACAPNDGPAWELLMANDLLTCADTTDLEVISIYWWEPIDITAPVSLDSAETLQSWSSVCSPFPGPTCQEVLHTTLEIDTWTESGTTGSYTLETTDGTTIAGTFRALACATEILCG